MEEEEGAVLYMIKRDKDDAKLDDVISLSKLKTLEYRLFRKMREKLRNFVSGVTQSPVDFIIEKYIKEAKELCKGFIIPHPIEFYIDICVLAFQLITRGPVKEKDYFTDLLMNEYIHFLEEVINVHEEKHRTKRSAYYGKVSFDSIVLKDQSKINYTGPKYRPSPKPQLP